MASKPGTLPRWATVGGAQIVEPTEGKKTQGFNVQEKPPSQYFNWLYNLIYQWTQYLNDPDSINLGSGLLADLASAIIARLTMDPAANATAAYTLFASLGRVRIYVGANDGTPALMITLNAYWDGDWYKITTGVEAHALLIRRDRVMLLSVPSGTDAWEDLIASGAGGITGWGTIFDRKSNPTNSTVVAPNSLHGKNIAKAWGTVTISSDGSTITINDGFNVESVAVNAAQDTVNVDFATNMFDENYCVVYGAGSTNLDVKATLPVTIAKAAGNFTLKLFVLDSTGAGVAPDFADVGGGQAISFDFVVYARQDS
jgi:hypothetical protein